LISYFLGGKVEPSNRREYGAARIKLLGGSKLLARLPQDFPVWMSHGDHVTAAPPGFQVTAETDNALGAVENVEKGIYGLQFHPEVAHRADGNKILGNFVKDICCCAGDWSAASFISATVDRIRDQIGDGKAVCGLSGGVDSSVAAALVARAIGDRLACIFVDNGLLRKDEFEKTLRTFDDLG